MEPIVVTWREILLAGAIVVFVYIAEAVLFLLKMQRSAANSRHLPLEALQARVTTLEAELSALKEMLDRPVPLAIVAKPVSEPEISPSTVSAPIENTGGSAYSRAIVLARQGVDADSLSSNCGISRGEAELIIALHRFDST